MSNRFKILMIQPYFGVFPVWFSAHLVSCGKNSSINWLFIHDADPPFCPFNNIQFVRMSLDDLNRLASEKLGTKIILQRPYKVCDLRPAFGLIFENYLVEYDFWGYFDLDLIWGNVRGFIGDDILDNHDVFSAAFHLIRGHFALFRNIEIINHLFWRIDDFTVKLSEAKSYALDEQGIGAVVIDANNNAEIRVWWNNWLYNYRHLTEGNATPSILPFVRNKWIWLDGQLFFQKDEIMYLHFMNWKKTMQISEVQCDSCCDRFVISYSDISPTGQSPSFRMMTKSRLFALFEKVKALKTSLYLMKIKFNSVFN